MAIERLTVRLRAGRTALRRAVPAAVLMALLAALLTALLAVGGLTSCTRGTDVAVTGGSTPRPGGTLRLAGTADLDHLDPAAADSVPAHLVLRALTRQLVAYRPESGPGSGAGTSGRPVADLAETVPAPTAGGTTYTFRIRAGARWDTSPPRQITAADVVRGFQRLCNPVAAGAMPAALPGLVAGMADYCRGFAKVSVDVNALRDYLRTHPIAGVRALDERTVRFVLTRPAGDFPQLLALPFASPLPVEALDHVPDSFSFRERFVSAGPYAIDRYTPGHELVLRRNPAWLTEADPVRPAYVDRIEIRYGFDARAVQRLLTGGGADLAWDTDVPATDVDRLAAAGDGRLVFADAGAGGVWLVLNLSSPNENRAMANQRVRQALNFAVDKRAVVLALGGPQLYRPHDQILPPAAAGYQPFNLYPSAEHRGDPGDARQLLDDAGYPRGLTLVLSHPASPAGRRLVAALTDQLGRGGITLRGAARGDSADTGGRRGPGPGASGWDLYLTETPTTWPASAGRVLFTRALSAAPAEPDPDGAVAEVRRLTEQAEAARSPQQAATRWAQADKRAMQGALVVPLAIGRGPRYRAERVRGWTPGAGFPRGDVTRIWLTDPR